MCQTNTNTFVKVLLDADIIPAESADIVGRTMSAAAPTALSSTVVLQAKGHTYNIQAVVSTKRKSKTSCAQTKQGERKPTTIKHICKVCDKVCRSVSELKVHIRVQ